MNRKSDISLTGNCNWVCKSDVVPPSENPRVRVTDPDSMYPLPWSRINVSTATSHGLLQSIVCAKASHEKVDEPN